MKSNISLVFLLIFPSLLFADYEVPEKVSLKENESLKPMEFEYKMKEEFMWVSVYDDQGNYRRGYGETRVVYWRAGSSKLPDEVRKNAEKHFGRAVLVLRAQGKLKSVIGTLALKAAGTEYFNALKKVGIIGDSEKENRKLITNLTAEALANMSLKNDISILIYYGLKHAQKLNMIKEDVEVLELARKVTRNVEEQNSMLTRVQILKEFLVNEVSTEIFMIDIN